MFFNRTLMLADDQSTDRITLHEMLRRTGLIVVAETANTDDALEKFERLRPDVVLMDVTLPGTWDALVVIQRMRRMHPEVTVLATGMASQNTVLMEAMTMGAQDFILKPFQQASVHACLQRNL
ncbi:MAG TPA: response regulator [Armatimonadota bacterium]|nr:response regulator [Armatimonadota bacterium]